MNYRLLLQSSLSLVGAVSVNADVVTLGADKDVTIFQNNVNNSNVAGPGIFSGGNGTNSARRGLISFNLSSIPAGSIISDVQFTLTLGQVAGSGGSGSTPSTAARTFRLHEVTKSWGSNNTPGTPEPTGASASDIGGTGQGYAARNGDATWTANVFNTSNWINSGGDFDPLASASLVAAAGAIRGDSFTFLSTPALVADAQGWLGNPSTNNGWLIFNPDENTQSFSFFTSEWSDRVAGNASQEPRLQITYTPVPEPSSYAFFVATIAILSFSLSRRCDTTRR